MIHITDIVPSLYKYTTPYVAKLILKGKSVRFTKPIEFNDPFEMSPFFESVFGIDKLITSTDSIDEKAAMDKLREQAVVMRRLPIFSRITEDQLKHFWHIAKPYIYPIARIVLTQFDQEFGQAAQKGVYEGVNKNFGVFCVTEDGDNLLMWSHYGDQHKGIAFEFDAKHHFFDHRKSSEDDFRHSRPVRYTATRPSIPFSKMTYTDLCLTKSLEWEYEHEWRIIESLTDAIDANPDTNSGIYLFSLQPECIKSVTLGNRISEEDQRCIVDTLNNDDSYGHVVVYKAQLVKNEYKLENVLVRRYNEDDLAQLLDSLLPADYRDEDEDYSFLIDDLHDFGFISLTQVRQLIIDNLSAKFENDSQLKIDIDEVKELPDVVYECINKQSLHCHVGIVRSILEHIFGQKWIEHCIAKYLTDPPPPKTPIEELGLDQEEFKEGLLNAISEGFDISRATMKEIEERLPELDDKLSRMEDAANNKSFDVVVPIAEGIQSTETLWLQLSLPRLIKLLTAIHKAADFVTAPDLAIRAVDVLLWSLTLFEAVPDVDKNIVEQLYADALIRKGSLLLSSHKTNAARHIFDYVLQRYRLSTSAEIQAVVARATYYIGESYIEKDRKKTLKIWTGLIKARSHSQDIPMKREVARVYFKMAMLHADSHRHREAIKCVDQMIQLLGGTDDDSTRIYIASAVALQALTFHLLEDEDRELESQRFLVDTFGQEPSLFYVTRVVRARVRIGRLLKKQHKYDESIRMLQDTLLLYDEVESSDIQIELHEALWLLSSIAKELGQVQQMIELCEQVIQRTHTSSHHLPAAPTFFAFDDMLSALVRLGEMDRVVTNCRILVEMFCNETLEENQTSVLWTLLRSGRDAEKAKSLDQALDIYDLGTILYPDAQSDDLRHLTVLMHQCRGSLLRKSGKIDEARTNYDVAICILEDGTSDQLIKDRFDILLSIASLLFDQDRYSEAQEYYRNIIKECQGNVRRDRWIWVEYELQATIMLVQSLKREGLEAEAITILDSTVNRFRDCDRPEVLRWLHYIHGSRVVSKIIGGMSDDARQAFDDFVHQFGNSNDEEVSKSISKLRDLLDSV